LAWGQTNKKVALIEDRQPEEGNNGYSVSSPASPNKGEVAIPGFYFQYTPLPLSIPVFNKRPLEDAQLLIPAAILGSHFSCLSTYL
jgi:hypothetical protein